MSLEIHQSPEEDKWHIYDGKQWAEGRTLVEAAVIAERERIIKLLNSAKGTGNNCNCDDCEQTNYYIDSLVALIKGEEQ